MKNVVILFISVFTLLSCKKEKDCFDQDLYDKYKGQGCTADCPGVKGCDGKTYCNECEANSKGIRVNH